MSNPIAIPAEMWYNIHMETEERIDYRKANNETLYAMRQMVDSYIWLTNLVPPLLDMVDEGKIALMPAERLSYLTGEEQLALADIMEDLEVTPSLSQAVKLKDLSASHRLDPDTMYEVMEKPKANQRETVKLDADTLRRFFPDYTPKQMETAILRMLEEAERERQRRIGRIFSVIRRNSSSQRNDYACEFWLRLTKKFLAAPPAR